MALPSLASALTQISALLPPSIPCSDPVLIVMSGLPGSGKSHLARQLAHRLPCTIVESDFVRKQLRPQPTYSERETIFTHRVARALIAQRLAQGCRVICDSTNLREQHRRRLCRLAERAGARWLILHVTSPTPIVRGRLRLRTRHHDPRDLSDAGWHIYRLLATTQEPFAQPHLLVDTRGDLSSALAQILQALNSPTPHSGWPPPVGAPRRAKIRSSRARRDFGD